MPDDVTLKFRLTGEDAGAGKALDEADKKVVKVSKTLKALGATGAVAGAAAGGLLAKSFADNLDIGQANAKLAGQLGLSSVEADKAGKVAGAVYADNWGESIDQVDETIKAVGTNLGSLSRSSTEDLKRMSEQALALASTFDIDVNESTKAAGALMKNGLAKDATQAFDIITSGEQLGLDRAGDFIDTLTEYSPQFSKLGIDGKHALTILSEGLRAGARDTDVIADAFKEFSLRAIDGSDTTSTAFKALGLNAKKMGTDIAAGGERASSATFTVLQTLDKMKDPVKQNTVGVALFGTQWEDTLRQILPAVAGAEEGMQGVEGATQKMADTATGDAKTKIESMRRSFEVWTQSLASSKGPLGDVSAGLLAFGGQSITAAGSMGQVVVGLAAMRGGLIAEKTAQIAGTAAKGVATAAQWAWNAALTANPIGIVIVAIAALVAALVYFFTKTEVGRRAFQASMNGIVTGFKWVKSAGGAAVDSVISKWHAFTGFFSGIGGWIRRSASGMWDGIWQAFRGAINRVVGGWNSLHFSIPGFSWGPISFSGFSLGVPRIPYLQAGGIVTRPTLAMLGEAGSEAVVPLDRGRGFGDVNITINGFMGNEDAIQRKVTEAVNQAIGRGYGTSFA